MRLRRVPVVGLDVLFWYVRVEGFVLRACPDD